MNLEILSFKEALKFKPKVKTHPIRIISYLDSFSRMENMINDNNWVRDTKKSWYCFDYVWPSEFQEYRDRFEFTDMMKVDMERWDVKKDEDGNFNLEAARKFMNIGGWPYNRHILFDENLARKIYTEFEEYKDEARQVMIHCFFGKNRSSAIGMAMNETYNWRVERLKEKFPHYHRFAYEIMKKVGEEFR